MPPSSAATRSSNTSVVGIHDAGVDVAELLQSEQRGGVVGVLEGERGGLVDRHGAGAAGRVRRMPGVQGFRGEADFAGRSVLSAIRTG